MNKRKRFILLCIHGVYVKKKVYIYKTILDTIIGTKNKILSETNSEAIMFCNVFGWMLSCVYVRNEKFDKADDDHDGRVSLNEFHAYYLKTHGKPPTNEQWFKFHLADKNNNGFISKYDVEQFEKQNTLFG